jgi:hypothetical protein
MTVEVFEFLATLARANAVSVVWNSEIMMNVRLEITPDATAIAWNVHRKCDLTLLSELRIFTNVSCL